MDVHLSDLPHEAARHPEVLVAFVVGSLVLGALGWRTAGRRGWAQLPAALAGSGLALALSVTLVRHIGQYPPGGFSPAGVLRECVVGPLSLARTYEKLNVAMLVPYALFATLATRRPVAVAASALAVSATVEYLQAATGVGTCQARDVAHNVAGGVLGALLAAGLLALLGRWGRRDRPGRRASRGRLGRRGVVTAGRAGDPGSSR